MFLDYSTISLSLVDIYFKPLKESISYISKPTHFKQCIATLYDLLLKHNFMFVVNNITSEYLNPSFMFHSIRVYQNVNVAYFVSPVHIEICTTMNATRHCQI